MLVFHISFWVSIYVIVGLFGSFSDGRFVNPSATQSLNGLQREKANSGICADDCWVGKQRLGAFSHLIRKNQIPWESILAANRWCSHLCRVAMADAAMGNRMALRNLAWFAHGNGILFPDQALLSCTVLAPEWIEYLALPLPHMDVCILEQVDNTEIVFSDLPE